MKSGIFEAQRRENMADSDPRLQVLLLEQQGVTKKKAEKKGRVSVKVSVAGQPHYCPERTRSLLANEDGTDGSCS
jgi:hypothetical protein